MRNSKLDLLRFCIIYNRFAKKLTPGALKKEPIKAVESLHNINKLFLIDGEFGCTRFLKEQEVFIEVNYQVQICPSISNILNSEEFISLERFKLTYDIIKHFYSINSNIYSYICM